MADVELYRSADRAISLDLKTDGREVWLTQAQMAELFGRHATVIGRHLANARTGKSSQARLLVQIMQ